MLTNKDSFIISDIRLLVARLERLSADSRWAHRASGIRGSLLRGIEILEKSENIPEDFTDQLVLLIREGYIMLESGAREIEGYKKIEDEN